MDKISLDFEQAKTKHLLFKSKLRSLLYGDVVDEAPVLSHFECTVGKWIYDHALKKYGHIPEMQELEKVHADIHTSARELVALYKSGKVEEARSGLTDMENIADHLVALLGSLEEKLKSDTAVGKVESVYQPAEVSMQELHDLAIANGKLDKIIKEQSGQLIKERKLLHDFFMQAPAALCILRGKDHKYELANGPYKKLIGDRDPTGMTVREALPELAGQGFYELLDEVFRTQKPFIGNEVPVQLKHGDQLNEVYVNFSYQTYTNSGGQSEGILVFAYDVTGQVKARKLIEESEAKYKALSEELKSAYEDLETKIKFRTIELEREKVNLQKEIASLKKK